MKSMKWVKNIIDVGASNVNAEDEATPVKTLDKFTPWYLNDNNVELFCKLPQGQVTTRYEGCTETANKVTPKKLKHQRIVTKLVIFLDQKWYTR